MGAIFIMLQWGHAYESSASLVRQLDNLFTFHRTFTVLGLRKIYNKILVWFMLKGNFDWKCKLCRQLARNKTASGMKESLMRQIFQKYVRKIQINSKNEWKFNWILSNVRLKMNQINASRALKLEKFKISERMKYYINNI